MALECHCRECRAVREAEEWRALAVKYSRELNSAVMVKARELSEVWRQNLTADYWLLIYTLDELGVLADLPAERVARAYTAMAKDRAHERANQIRPITARQFSEPDNA